MSREELVDVILDLSGDEVDVQLLTEMAKETYHQLVTRLVGIAEYYKNETNE